VERLPKSRVRDQKDVLRRDRILAACTSSGCNRTRSAPPTGGGYAQHPPAITPPADASLEELEWWGYERLSDLVGTAPEEDAADEAA
jgi:hypothetical protein